MYEVLHDYELVVIAGAQLDDESLAALQERVTGWVANGKGTMSNVNVWGRRRLTYAISKQTEGIYVQFNFQMLASNTRELERDLRLDEQVIRHLLIRLDED